MAEQSGDLHRATKRRRGSSATPDVDMSQEELERRERQRKLREIALKLRAEGKDYNPKAYRRRALAVNLKDDRKPRRAQTIQLIIIPIFWNSREDEKAAVMAAASRAQDLLRGGGIKVDTDPSHKLTPGQKFRHWEERGVMMRIEIGPKEAEAGLCVLAQSATAGEVAKRRRIALGSALVKAVGGALGVEITPHVLVGVPGTGGDRKPSKKLITDSDDDLAVAENRHDEKAKAFAASLPSGDDLEGDFDAAALLGRGEAEKSSGKKTNKKKAQHAVDGKIDDEAMHQVREQKKKKDKIVTFP